MTERATVGVTEHGNSAELVTVDEHGRLLDRRRIDLTTGLSTHPYHHEGAWAVGRYKDSAWARDISLDDAIALIERVHEAADEGARVHLEALAADVPAPIEAIAIRACPPLPDTIEARIRDNRAQSQADSVMYRLALAKAAKDLGWRVVWYDREDVFVAAEQALGADVGGHMKAMGKEAGAPWRKAHKQAAAAAIAAVGTRAQS